MKTKILIDGRFLTQQATGVNRFAYEICKALKYINFDYTILAPSDILFSDYELEGMKINIISKWSSSHIWDQIGLPLYLHFKEKEPYILVSFTGLGPIFLKNHISTIHDLAFLECPQWYSKCYYLFYKFLTPLLVKRSLSILTVSEFSKKEILKYYPYAQNKVEVIYNAVSDSVINSNKQENKERYFLAVSSINPRKNFIRLVKAFQNANLPISTKLYIIGKPNNVFASVQLDKDSDNVKFLGYVDDKKLSEYYSNAIALLYPSLYEGFGIPPLEAMKNGCPSIVSDIAVFHEIYGNAVVYFNPYDIDDMSSKISDFISFDKTQLKSDMEVCLTNYSWIRSARKIGDLLNNIH